jgi:hypothetical protein
MSPIHGCKLSSKILAINPKIKIVLITAYGDIINKSIKFGNCQEANHKY